MAAVAEAVAPVAGAAAGAPAEMRTPVTMLSGFLGSGEAPPLSCPL